MIITIKLLVSEATADKTPSRPPSRIPQCELQRIVPAIVLGNATLRLEKLRDASPL